MLLEQQFLACDIFFIFNDNCFNNVYYNYYDYDEVCNDDGVNIFNILIIFVYNLVILILIFIILVKFILVFKSIINDRNSIFLVRLLLIYVSDDYGGDDHVFYVHDVLLKASFINGVFFNDVIFNVKHLVKDNSLFAQIVEKERGRIKMKISL